MRQRRQGDPPQYSAAKDATNMIDQDKASALVVAIRAGDVAAVRKLLDANPALATSKLGGRAGTRTPLHVVADWPGFFANGPAVVRVLLAAGGDPNAREPGKGSETPLHWTASSDDVDVASALIEGGADIEVPDGSIGTPLDNAVGYACWEVARLLVARGARVDKLWHAAALGLTARLEQLLDEQRALEPHALSQAFWHACAAGQRRTAEYLLAHGADLNWVPDYARGTPLDVASSLGTQRQTLISWLRDRGARSQEQQP
jgi:ankyrin repeat protein